LLRGLIQPLMARDLLLQNILPHFDHVDALLDPFHNRDGKGWFIDEVNSDIWIRYGTNGGLECGLHIQIDGVIDV